MHYGVVNQNWLSRVIESLIFIINRMSTRRVPFQLNLSDFFHVTQPDSFSARIKFIHRNIVHNFCFKLLTIPSVIISISIYARPALDYSFSAYYWNCRKLVCLTTRKKWIFYASLRMHPVRPDSTERTPRARGARGTPLSCALLGNIKKKKIRGEGCFEKDTADEQRVMVNPFPFSRQKVIFMRRIFVSLTDASLTGEFSTDPRSLNFDPRGW